MYKIFQEEKQIVLAETPIKDSHNIAINLTVDNDFERIVKINLEKVVLHNQDLEKLWSSFKKSFTILEAAGGLVFWKDECVFIKRLGKWDLPKGKIEENESPSQAALREVEEECGLGNLKIDIEKPFVTYHMYPLKEKMVLKPTYWYKMSVAKKQKLKPQSEEDITEAIWLSYNQTKEIRNNTYPNILMVLNHFIQES